MTAATARHGFTSPQHDARNAALLGMAFGLSFTGASRRQTVGTSSRAVRGRLTVQEQTT